MGLIRRPCNRTDMHDEHTWERSMPLAVWWCPGVWRDHDSLCCTECDTHVIPHRGCILR